MVEKMNEITTVISTVGFPIACAIALGWYAMTTTNKIIALTEKVTDALSKSATAMEEIKDAIKEIGGNKKNAYRTDKPELQRADISRQTACYRILLTYLCSL